MNTEQQVLSRVNEYIWITFNGEFLRILFKNITCLPDRITIIQQCLMQDTEGFDLISILASYQSAILF